MKLIVRSLLVLALILTRTVTAATYRVPQDYPTIQAGIDAAVAIGDIVLVAPGTYHERIDFLGKAIVVTSSGGREATVIDARETGPVVTFANAEGRGSVLEGFTIQNGYAFDVNGAGISCRGASPTIRANVLLNNVAEAGSANDGDGGGIWCDASPRIEANLIQKNWAHRGGGIASHGAAEIVNNVISANETSDVGSGIFQDGTALIEGNLITDNYNPGKGGLGIHSEGGALIRGNTVSGGADQIRCVDDRMEEDTVTGSVQCLGAATVTGVTVHGETNRPGISCVGSAIITSTTVSGAGIGIQGGAVLINDLVYANHEEGVWADGVTLENVTIAGNGRTGYRGTGMLRSCIVWNNAQGSFHDSPTATYSDIEGGWPGAGNIDADPQLVDPGGLDFSLAPTSPCVDEGDPANASCDPDLAGSPRRLDGHLSGHERVDMGALELDHVHLAIAGSPAPGATLTLTTTGTAGLRVVLLIGLAAGETCAPPYGALYFSLADTWFLVPWGTVPSTVDIKLPGDLTLPPLIVFQEVALADPGPVGDASNAVSLQVP